MNLQNEYLFGYATSIQERISILEPTTENQALSHLKKWRSRKTLLTDSDFHSMLKLKNISEVQYDLAVSPLNEASLKKLFSYVKKQEWYQLHKKIFSIPRTYTPKTIDDTLYFHVSYYMEFVAELSAKSQVIKFADSCLQSLKKDFTTYLMQLARKTLVWDVHEHMNHIPHNSLNDTELLQNYLVQRFGELTAEYFFLSYPTLTRLLAERMLYAMNNFRLFMNALEQSKWKISQIFGITPPFHISSFHTGKGDSHNRGKSSTVFVINQIRLVYKYRNNEILDKYHELLSWIEINKPNFHYYKIRVMTEKDFSLEEYIENESCTCENEIIQYYKNYGYLAALTYWLGATDLHKDNLIAKRSHPVLIDVETLFGAEERRIYSDHFNKIKYFESNSAISTGMLPMEKYWKKQIDFSALNGIRQKLPYKVRQLLNEDNSKIAYELQEAYTQLSNNIPKLNNDNITYEAYSHFITSSFEEMLLWLQEYKDAFYNQILKNCSSTVVRVVLRDTQDYANFLDFSTHPSCMIDYIEREKIFENLWNHSFIDPKVVLYETAALCRHDIPYFYTLSSSKNLYSCDGIIKYFFNHSITDMLKQHFISINTYRISYSLFLLGESLDCLSSKCKPVPVPGSRTENNCLIRKATRIADMILNNVIINEKEKCVLWPEPVNHGEKLSIDYPDFNLYHGTSGLFIFFYHLNALSPDPKYEYVLRVLEYEIFSDTQAAACESAFYGNGAKITAAFIAYHFKKDVKYYNYLMKYLQETEKTVNNIDSWDWLHGKSSLLSVLASIYTEIPIPLILHMLKDLTLDLSDIFLPEVGFAHGCSGVLFSLLQVNKILKDAQMKQKITDLYQHMKQLLQNCNQFTPAWCNGTSGINYALSEFAKQYPAFTVQFIQPTQKYVQNNSCICHGTYGQITDFCNMLMEGTLSQKAFEKETAKIVRKEIRLCRYRKFIPLGLFNGLSGIGYQLLRCICPEKILDVLSLILYSH